jgi:hypothetical protein
MERHELFLKSVHTKLNLTTVNLAEKRTPWKELEDDVTTRHIVLECRHSVLTRARIREVDHEFEA